MSDFDYAATAKRVTEREVAVARLASDYAALVAHLGLTEESTSEALTDAARNIVIDGATRALTVDDLKGRDPGEGAVRPFWKAARAVRIGLVKAIGAEKPDTQTDWLKLVKQAAENAANKGEFSADAIMAAVAEVLTTEESAAA